MHVQNAPVGRPGSLYGGPYVLVPIFGWGIGVLGVIGLFVCLFVLTTPGVPVVALLPQGRLS